MTSLKIELDHNRPIYKPARLGGLKCYAKADAYKEKSKTHEMFDIRRWKGRAFVNRTTPKIINKLKGVFERQESIVYFGRLYVPGKRRQIVKGYVQITSLKVDTVSLQCDCEFIGTGAPKALKWVELDF